MADTESTDLWSLYCDLDNTLYRIDALLLGAHAIVEIFPDGHKEVSVICVAQDLCEQAQRLAKRLALGLRKQVRAENGAEAPAKED